MTGDHGMNPAMRPGALATVGDLTICDGLVTVVTEIHTYAPNTPNALAAPINPGCVVRAVVTPNGVRHFGHLPGERYRGCEIAALAPDGVSFEGDLIGD